MKDRRGSEKEGGRAVGLAVKGFRMVRLPFPRDPQVIHGRFPKVFGLGLPVAGRDQQRINADVLRCLRQRAGNVTETARLGVRDSLSRDNSYSHQIKMVAAKPLPLSNLTRSS